MTPRVDLLEQRRDQALRDLADLERQVEAGEIPPEQAAALRRRYEAAAALAMAELEKPAVIETTNSSPPVSRRRRWTWNVRAVYAAAAAVAVLAAFLVLPRYLGARPAGGLVSGNEVLQSAPTATPRADLSNVSDKELETVVRANPNVPGMRIALADRYAEKGDYTKAVPQYTEVLRQDPGNPVALSRLGSVLLRLGQPDEATRFVDQALAQDPRSVDALWTKANVRLYGYDDPAGALRVLRELRSLPLTPTVRSQAEALTTTAEKRQRERR